VQVRSVTFYFILTICETATCDKYYEATLSCITPVLTLTPQHPTPHTPHPTTGMLCGQIFAGFMSGVLTWREQIGITGLLSFSLLCWCVRDLVDPSDAVLGDGRRSYNKVRYIYIYTAPTYPAGTPI
jgi:hypothetical protein